MAAHNAKTWKDDLRTGRPLWLDTPRTSVMVKADPGRQAYDVIVVGAGISGALVAEALTRAGKSVLVVDRRGPVSGSTPASTAMIQHELDVPLTKLRTLRGGEVADAAWRRSAKAVGALTALTQALEIKCELSVKPALYLAGNEMNADELAREAAARQAIGIRADLLDAERLRDDYGIDREAAILSNASASANPAQLAAGLLRKAKTRGATIAAPIEITDMAERDGSIALATSEGRVFVAEHAVFATGYEFLPQMQSPLHRVTSTWAIATAAMPHMPKWMHETIVWEASDPYLYFRAAASGRLIAGGEDEETSEKNTNNKVLRRKAAAIRRKLQELTGVRIGKVEYRWAAPFSVTKDGLPIIDRVPGFERVFSVMGFGGNGITFSMIAAEIVAGAIAGKADPDAHCFAMR